MITAPARPEDLFRRLDAVGVRHTTLRHRALFSVKDGEEIKAQLPGGHSKNLFLKDSKARLWLICALGDTRIDLKRLPKMIGSGRLTFASAEQLWISLGVRPGSVTPFALINNADHAVTVVLDQGLTDHAMLNFHPLENTATTAVTLEDFLKFLAASGFTPIMVDFRHGQDCEDGSAGPF